MKRNAAHSVDMAEAEARFEELCDSVNRSGHPVMELKDGKPWVEIAPLDAAKSVPTDTRQAMDEMDAMEANPLRKTCLTAEDLFSELGI